MSSAEESAAVEEKLGGGGGGKPTAKKVTKKVTKKVSFASTAKNNDGLSPETYNYNLFVEEHFSNSPNTVIPKLVAEKDTAMLENVIFRLENLIWRYQNSPKKRAPVLSTGGGNGGIIEQRHIPFIRRFIEEVTTAIKQVEQAVP